MRSESINRPRRTMFAPLISPAVIAHYLSHEPTILCYNGMQARPFHPFSRRGRPLRTIHGYEGQGRVSEELDTALRCMFTQDCLLIEIEPITQETKRTELSQSNQTKAFLFKSNPCLLTQTYFAKTKSGSATVLE